MAAALAAIVLAVLDGAIANVALPTIAHDLGVTPAASVWIVTGYQIAVVVALLPFAALGESIGYARVFTFGVVLFTAASALCAVSPVLPLLVAARIAQGFGGAAIMAVLAALLRHTYPIRMLGTGLGLNGRDRAGLGRRADARGGDPVRGRLALAVRREHPDRGPGPARRHAPCPARRPATTGSTASASC